MNAPRPLRRRAQGFVLVLTLWILAGIAIAAAYFGERVQASLRAAAARQDLAAAELAASDARAEILYRLAMAPMSVWGSGDPPNVLRLDGRAYRVAPGVTVELQDTAGLLNLNNSDDGFLARLLQTRGVPQNRVGALVDTLRDYTDADELRRLNGAEAPQYAAAKLPARPPNAALATPLALRDVLGWAEQAVLWDDPRFLDAVTVDGPGRLNPNTASAVVLQALPGVTPDVARVFLERRELQPIDAAWVDSVLGTNFNALPSPIQTFPAGEIRVTVRADGLPWRVRYNVRLTPTSRTGPWVVRSAHRLPLAAPGAASAPAPSAGPGLSAAVPLLDAPPHAAEPARLPPRPAQPASSPFLLPG